MKLIHIAVFGTAVLFAQDRPGLFFREDWKPIPAETPVTQQHVENPSLLLALYGPGKAGIRKSHHDKPADDPYYIRSGECKGNWALTLRDKASLVDLTGREREFNIVALHWRSLNIDKVAEGEGVDRPDLSRVDEIGWTDLMTGGTSSACSRVDWIEVYGTPVKRS